MCVLLVENFPTLAQRLIKHKHILGGSNSRPTVWLYKFNRLIVPIIQGCHILGNLAGVGHTPLKSGDLNFQKLL